MEKSLLISRITHFFLHDEEERELNVLFSLESILKKLCSDTEILTSIDDFPIFSTHEKIIKIRICPSKQL